MKNKEYWIKRSEQNLTDLLDDSEKILALLDSFYKEAIESIDKDIRSLYSRFMVKNGVDNKKALELIRGSEFRRWQMSMKEYLKKIEIDNDQALLLELNTLTMRERISRLEALEAEILAHCGIIASKEERVISSFLSDSLKDTYYKNIYQEYMDKNPKAISLIDKHKVALSKNQINRVLSLPWSGSNYSANIWKNSYFIGKKVQSLVAKNIMAGFSIERLTKDLTKVFTNSYKANAKRLLRTEIAYVKGQADYLTYKNLGVEEYEILATLDMRTSHICKVQDGKHYPLEKAKVGINYPPFHPNCRSTTIKYDPDHEGISKIVKRENSKDKKALFKKLSRADKDDKIKERIELSDKAREKAIELGYNPLEDDEVVPTLREESIEWVKSLSNDERRAIEKYTFNGKDKDGLRLFEKINGYLENKYNSIDQKEEEIVLRNIANIDEALLKNRLNHDIIVYRNDKYVNELNGEIKKFLSTSVTRKGVINGKPNVAIIVPKGSSGAYIELLAKKKFKKQREFLLNKDTKLDQVFKNKDYTILKVRQNEK